MLPFGAEYFVFQFAAKNIKIKIHGTIILPVVLYGCETWSLTLRVGSRLMVFGPKRDEVKGIWRKLHNEEHNDLYSSTNIIPVIQSRRMGWTRHVARMGERCMQVFGGET